MNDQTRMEPVTVLCDRCGNAVEGLQSEHGTAGFYRVSDGHWARFANAGERIVCDACMWADSRYQAAYPQVARNTNKGTE